MTVIPHSLYFSVPPVEDFDITEVIEAESLAVPNTLPKHNFQAAFKK
jgi:hypothetical protein